jgi:hypothetical protein
MVCDETQRREQNNGSCRSFHNLRVGFISIWSSLFLIASSSHSDKTEASPLLMTSLLAEAQAIWKSWRDALCFLFFWRW